MKTNQTPAKRSAYARAAAWIIAALVSLVLGVIAGAIMRQEWRWGAAVAGFAGYVLAFRQGLAAARPEGLDREWRLSSSAGSATAPRRPPSHVPRFAGGKKVVLARWRFGKAPDRGSTRRGA